jgi:hypothetical protein
LAKRRIIRKESEEPEKEEEVKKPAFKAPDFDETDFLQTENRSAKLIYISLATAVLAGIVTFGLMTLLHITDIGGLFTIPLIIPVIFAGLTIYIYTKFGIDIRNLEWKKWLENGFMFTLAWFAVWLVSMNPPFSDFADPTIAEPLIEIEVGSGQVIHYIGDNVYIDDRKTEFSPISDLEDVRTVRIYTTITDNWKLESKSIELLYKDAEGNWIELEEGLSMNLTLGRYDEELEVPDNVSDKLGEEWLISDDEVRKDHMYLISFQLTNQTQVGISDILDLKAIYTAKDSRGNENIREVPIRLTF